MAIELTRGSYMFWDEHLTDTQHTDAVLSVNRPDRAGNVFSADKPWEGNQCDSFTVIKEEGYYRLYYRGKNYPETHGETVCYAESTDGITWERPELGLCEFDGSKKNNILFQDNGCNYVMKDPNPDCPENERYKMFEPYSPTGTGQDRILKCYTSADGIRFSEHHICETPSHYTNMFDSTNTVWWDPCDGLYRCFLRGCHGNTGDPLNPEPIVREVRVMSSPDCVHWSESQPLDYGGSMDYQIYTGCVLPYGDYWIGFPTRYNVRAEWDGCYERLTGKEYRRARMKDGARLGLAVTDCLFMSSRDKLNWYRFDEAILTPGPEDGYNWEYGDCYPAVGLIETPGRFSPEPELSLLCESHHWTDKPVELIRYIYRKDGFASYKAGFREKRLRTVPVRITGDRLSINFRSSARGYIKLSVLDEYCNPIGGYATCGHFGDTTRRIMDFEKPLTEIADREVRLEFDMSDAEIYSLTVE